MSSFYRRMAVAGLAGIALAMMTGCHSSYIEATVKNASGAPLSLVEVDYPSASFGRENLADGVEYHYRFKIIGSGPTKVLWTDAARQEHTVPGPVLHENDEGRMRVTIGPSGAAWDLTLKPR